MEKANPMFIRMSSDIDGMRQLAKQVATIRWIVVIVLFTFVFGFETVEHIIIEREGLNWRLSFEVFFFGIIGPILVFGILSWIKQNLLHLVTAYEEIHSLNTDLEIRIEARTAELTRANENLRQLDQLKSEFVSLVSHELRTPLTNIHGGIELVLKNLDPCAESSQNVLNVVQSEVNRLSKLVRHILDVSALQAGQLQLNRGLVMLRPLIHSLIARLETNNLSHNFVVNIQSQLQPLWADEDRLEDIIGNLISNAIKYSPQGGKVFIEAQTGDDSFIHLSVKDQGIGIAKEEQERLFQPFYRGENASKTAQGYGLGLYFCHELIQAHGGKIWVDSMGKQGQGTTFHLCLPLDRESEI